MSEPDLSEVRPSLSPRPLSELEPDALTGELRQLATLARAGLEMAPLLVVPAATEEQFYRSNALPAQLAELFAIIDQNDPDEDDIEELSPQALGLFKRHFLLDEVIDSFYDALDVLPSKVRVRRAGEAGRVVTRGRPALIALKDTWADAWRFDSLMERLGATHSVAVGACPVLVGVADDTEAPAAFTAQVQAVLSEDVRVWQHDALGVTRLG